MNGIDNRVRYTRMMIEQSFLELLAEKPAGKITVTELCQRAQINRATFYKHYLDVADLLEKMEEDLFDRIRSFFDAENLKLRDFLVKMMYYTRENYARFMALGGDNGDSNLMTKTFMVCYEKGFPLLSNNLHALSKEEKEMLFAFLSHGSGAILALWIRNGMKESPEEVAQLVLNLCSITADGVLQPNWKSKYSE